MGIKNINGELHINGEKVDPKLLTQLFDMLCRQNVLLPFYIEGETFLAPHEQGQFGVYGYTGGCSWGNFIANAPTHELYVFTQGESNGGPPPVIVTNKATGLQYYVCLDGGNTSQDLSHYISSGLSYWLKPIT